MHLDPELAAWIVTVVGATNAATAKLVSKKRSTNGDASAGLSTQVHTLAGDVRRLEREVAELKVSVEQGKTQAATDGRTLDRLAERVEGFVSRSDERHEQNLTAIERLANSIDSMHQAFDQFRERRAEK